MKTPPWLYGVSLVPPAILVAIATAQPWVPPDELFQDPLVVAIHAGDGCCHVYFGFFSNLGVLLWSGTASVCCFASVLLIQKQADRRQVLFMVSAGLLTGLLLFDDLFQGHEVMYPKIRGVTEQRVFAAYIVLTGLYLAFFRSLIVRNGYSLMLLSLSLFGISMLVDLFVVAEGSVLPRIGEDGTKFIGIAVWTVFHSRVAWLLCTENDRGPGALKEAP